MSTGSREAAIGRLHGKSSVFRWIAPCDVLTLMLMNGILHVISTNISLRRDPPARCHQLRDAVPCTEASHSLFHSLPYAGRLVEGAKPYRAGDCGQASELRKVPAVRCGEVLGGTRAWSTTAGKARSAPRLEHSIPTRTRHREQELVT